MNLTKRVLYSMLLTFLFPFVTAAAELESATPNASSMPDCTSAAKKIAAYKNIAVPIAGPAGQTQSSELYWVTFSGDCSCDQIWIMQIDALGNITKAPKAVLSIAQYGDGASALGKNGTSKLNLWHWKSSTLLMRVIIDKNSLNANVKTTTSISSYEDDFLHVTQNLSKNILLAEVPLGTLKSFPLQSNGMPSNPGKAVTPSLTSESDEASISADGLVLVSNRGTDDPNSPSSDKLYLQLLDENGAPKGPPTLLAGFKDIEAVDVTNTLEQGKRFVVYVVDTGTTPDDKVFLQVVNETGKKVGGPKTINIPPNRDEDNQTVAIDPLGRFVLLTMDGKDYGCEGDDILMYQGLNNAGTKQGNPKVMIGCNFTSNDIKNLDLLKE
jgi:hypothetical protein